MRQGRRIRTKNNQIDQVSSVFKSKVPRKILEQPNATSLGPGSYDVALPMIKPKFQAIQKNSHTIILKVHEKPSPAFQSLQPRFTQKNINNNSHSQSQINTFDSEESIQKPSQIAEVLQIYEAERRQKRLENRKQILRKVKKLGFVSELKNQASFDDHHSKDSLSIQKNVRKEMSPKLTQKMVKSEQQQQKIKDFISDYHRRRKENVLKEEKKKGSEWSKYKEQRNLIWQRKSFSPGPGAYDDPEKVYKETSNKSWQFKSITTRPVQNQSNDKPVSEKTSGDLILNMSSSPRKILIHSKLSMKDIYLGQTSLEHSRIFQ